jgi:hypothetical protein
VVGVGIYLSPPQVYTRLIMARTFQNIADDVSTDLNLGTTLDTIVLNRVYAAHRFMERNYTFEYMNTLRTLVIAAGALTFTLTAGTKRVQMIRFDYESQYRYIEKVDPTDVIEAETTIPAVWWLEGTVTAHIFKAFSEATTLTIVEALTKQAYAAGDSDWLTDQGGDALQYKALMLMAGPAKDLELKQLYADDFQEALNVVLALDDELKRGTANPQMRYGQDY